MTTETPFNDEQIKIIRQVCVPFGLEEISDKPLHFKFGMAPHMQVIHADVESKEFPGLPVIGISNGHDDPVESGHGVGAIDGIRDEIRNRFEALAKSQKKSSSAYPGKKEPKVLPEKKSEIEQKQEFEREILAQIAKGARLPKTKSSLTIIDDSQIYHDPKDKPKAEEVKVTYKPAFCTYSGCGVEIPLPRAKSLHALDIPREEWTCECHEKCKSEETKEKIPEHGINQGRNRRTENMETKPESKTTETMPIVASSTNAIVRPAVSPQEAITAWREFNELKAAIISKDDKQKIGNSDFIKKSGWRKLATFFNLTDKITEEVQLPHPNGGGWTWKIKVLAIAPNGRTSEGVGICSTSERKFAHIEHDTYATAHTRAKNRAISDMIAGGEVSAEEIE